jgi:hypothetical protein
MGTDNPKVSAYVPQAIKDRLKEFRVEHSLSESQAVTTILAEYFGMAQSLTRSLEGLKAEGVTLARMEALEKKLDSLNTSSSGIPSELLEKIDQLTTSLKFLEKRLEVVEHSSLLSGLTSESQEADLVTVPQEVEEVVSQLNLGLEEDNQSADEAIGSGQPEPIEPVLTNLLGEPLEEIKPISGRRLSKLRFGLGKDTVAGAKKRFQSSVEEFTEWTRGSDPDRIPWKYVETPSQGYIPAEELSSELKSKLLKWIKENLQ